MTIPLRTFVARIPPGKDRCPWPLGSSAKHVSLTHLPVQRKMMIGGGDYGNTRANDSGCRMYFTYETRTDTWECISGYCHAGGETTPGACDQAPIAYDPKRGVVWHNAGMIGDQSGPCNLSMPAGFPTGSTIISGLNNFDPVTRKWTNLSVRNQLDATTLIPCGAFWAIDPVNDEIVTMSSASIWHWSLAPKFSRSNPKNRTTSLPIDPAGFNGVNGWGNPQGSQCFWGLDVIGRKAYILLPTGHFANWQQVGTAPRFWSYDLDRQIWAKLPDPPVSSCSLNEVRPVWDSRNRALIYPHYPDVAGVLDGMYVWDTTQLNSLWQSFPVTHPMYTVAGNCSAYDPDENVVILGGTAFGRSAIKAFFLWRYN